MKVLWDAIFTKYTSSALPAAVTGGLHFTEALPGTSFPLIVYSQITDTPDWTFSSGEEMIHIQFQLFDLTGNPTTLESIDSTLRTVYDDCTLSVTGWTFVYMQRQPGGGTWTKDEDGYYQCTEEYEIYLTKSR